MSSGNRLHHRTTSQSVSGFASAATESELSRAAAGGGWSTRSNNTPSTPQDTANTATRGSPAHRPVLVGGHIAQGSSSSSGAGLSYSSNGKGYGVQHAAYPSASSAATNNTQSRRPSFPLQYSADTQSNSANMASSSARVPGASRSGTTTQRTVEETYGHSTSNSLSRKHHLPSSTTLLKPQELEDQDDASFQYEAERMSYFVSSSPRRKNFAANGAEDARGQSQVFAEEVGSRKERLGEAFRERIVNTESTIFFSPDGMVLNGSSATLLGQESTNHLGATKDDVRPNGLLDAPTSPWKAAGMLPSANSSSHSLGGSTTVSKESPAGYTYQQVYQEKILPNAPIPTAATTINPNFVFQPKHSANGNGSISIQRLGNKGSPTLAPTAVYGGASHAQTADNGGAGLFRFGSSTTSTSSRSGFPGRDASAAGLNGGLSAKDGAAALNGDGNHRIIHHHARKTGSQAISASRSSNKIERRPGDYFWWWSALLQASWISRIFVLVTLAEATIDITIESILLGRYNDQKNVESDLAKERALPVFLIVFGLAHVYQFVLAVDAVVNKNTILVIGMVIFNGCMLIYSGIQIGEIRDVLGTGTMPGQTIPIQVLTATIPVVVGIAEVVFAGLSWYLWKEFGWQVYKRIGADRALKRRYLQYQIYVALLKFDFFVFCAFCIQLVLAVFSKYNAERIITIIAPVFSLAVLVLAWWSVRRENRTGVYAFMVGLTGALVYFVYKLFRLYKDPIYREIYKSLTIFSVLSIILLVVTFGMTIRCLLNFGRGLKAAIERITTARLVGHRAMTSHGHIIDVIKHGDSGALPMSGTGRDAYLHHRLSID